MEEQGVLRQRMKLRMAPERVGHHGRVRPRRAQQDDGPDVRGISRSPHLTAPQSQTELE
jgi:hypothetical protein